MEDNVEKLICDDCGTDFEVEYCIDPYIEEICDKVQWRNLCHTCYQTCLWEI